MKNKLLFIFFLLFFIFDKVNAINFGGIRASDYDSYWSFWSSHSFLWNIGFWNMWTIITIIVLIFIFNFIKKSFWWTKVITTPRLVITKLNIDEKNNECVLIEARRWWIWNFILTKLKLDNKYIFLVERKEEKISLDIYDLNWNIKTVLNFDSISSIIVWYERKLKLVIYIWFVLFLVMFYSFVIWFIWALILAYYYYVSKSTKIEFWTNWWTELKLFYSPSIIENINLDIKKAKNIEEIITNLKNK